MPFFLLYLQELLGKGKKGKAIALTILWMYLEFLESKNFLCVTVDELFDHYGVILEPNQVYYGCEEEAKNKTIYRPVSFWGTISLALQGLLPSLPLMLLTDVTWWQAVLAPIFTVTFLFMLIWRKLHGYTGDCCGAVCLLAELSFYLVLSCSSIVICA